MSLPVAIDPGDVASLDELDDRELVALVTVHGAVHLRGFDADGATLDSVSSRWCDRFTCDPGKVVIGGLRGTKGPIGRAARVATRLAATARKRPVDDPSAGDGGRARYAPFGGFGINPHTENSFLPDAAPDLVWFACQFPAESGGDSLLCDGADLLDRLDDDLDQFLRTTPIRYESTLTESQWRSVWSDGSADELASRLNVEQGASVRVHEDHSVTVVFDSIQIGTSLGGREAVRTNLLSRHPYDGIGRDHAERTADGKPVDRELLLRLLDATRPQTAVRLEAGDLLVIDNSRVMHGRTPFGDERRRVITRCGWLRDGLLD
ncbi:MAG: TauD/TfdA family dioxygenase [Actinomycetota bacterium]